MAYNKIRVTACVLSTALLISGSGMNVNAASISSKLPAAGFALALEEGSSLKSIKAEVASNTSNSALPQDKAITAETILSGTNTAGESSASAKISDTEIVEPVTPTTVAPVTAEEAAAAEEEKQFSSLVIAKVNDYVNVRSIASEDGEVVGKLYDKSVGSFIQEENGWYQIQSGNVTGYVKAEYCVTGEEAVELAKAVGTRIATVTTTTLKVREEANIDAAVLGLVPIEDELIVTEELDGWVKVDIEEGFGFVSTDFVTLSTEFVQAESKEEEEARLAKEEAEREAANAAASAAKKQSSSSSSSETVTYAATSGSGQGSDVAGYALQFVGNPYVYGGTSLTNGADCSGFVMSVYQNFGISLPHSSAADRSVGYDVGGIENAQPGDLICYSGHVAMYIGNGQIVHASTSKTGIIVSSAGYRQALAVRRIF